MDTIRVGVSRWPHMKPECFPSQETGCEPGVELEILHTIMLMANLKMHLVVTNGSSCGKTPYEQGSNGSWTDLYKMLQDNEIDVIGNLCNVNKVGQIDQNFFSMSWPVYQYQNQFVIQTPDPSPLSFALSLPFSGRVWVAYFVTSLFHFTLVIVYTYVRYGNVRKFRMHFLNTMTILSETCCCFVKHVPFQRIWPLWLLILTTMCIFYNTYILSAVLHPSVVGKPFSNASDFAKALLSGEYRLLSYRDPPSVPANCLGKKCEQTFNEAIKRHGFQYVSSGSGKELLEAIVESDQKLVLDQGMPFVSLYLSEYHGERDRLWIIDSGISSEVWSAYAWRKNFTYANQFNAFLSNTADYRFQVLAWYAEPFGPQPHTGDTITEMARKQAISLYRFRTLFSMHFGAAVAAGVVLLIEIACSKRSQRRVHVVTFVELSVLEK